VLNRKSRIKSEGEKEPRRLVCLVARLYSLCEKHGGREGGGSGVGREWGRGAGGGGVGGLLTQGPKSVYFVREGERIYLQGGKGGSEGY